MALPLPVLTPLQLAGQPDPYVRRQLALTHYKYPQLDMSDVATAVWEQIRRVHNYLVVCTPNWSARVRNSCLFGFMETIVHRFVTPYLGEVNKQVGLGNMAYGALHIDQPLFWNGVMHAVTQQRCADLTEQFIDTLLTLYARIHADVGVAAVLAPAFGNAGLTDIKFKGSDPHHGNQQVLVLEFGAAKVVYKPRSVNVDAHFVGHANSVASQINTWHNGANGTHAIPTYRYISRPGYGYVQYLDLQASIDGTKNKKDARKRYLWIMGAYATIAYLFGISDQHVGNVLICRRPKPHNNPSRPYHYGLPYLCDLEIAFNHSMLTGANVHSILTNQIGFFQPAAGAMISEGEQDLFDRFIYASQGGHTVLTNAMVPGQNFGRKDTQNLLKKGGATVKISGSDWNHFLSGMRAVWETIRQRPLLDKTGLANLFNGDILRFHAIPTGAQLMALTHAAHQGILFPTAPFPGNLNPLLIQAGWGTPVAVDPAYIPSLVTDWNRMDVAYYIRTVGAAGVQHVSAAATTPVGGIVSPDPLLLARNRITTLPAFPYANYNVTQNWIRGLVVGTAAL